MVICMILDTQNLEISGFSCSRSIQNQTTSKIEVKTEIKRASH